MSPIDETVPKKGMMCSEHTIDHHFLYSKIKKSCWGACAINAHYALRNMYTARQSDAAAYTERMQNVAWRCVNKCTTVYTLKNKLKEDSRVKSQINPNSACTPI